MDKKDKTIQFSVIEHQKARSFIECIDDNALTFMVKTILSEHFKEFQPYIVKLGQIKL